MIEKVAITGMGIFSSIGNSVEENFNALVSSKHGISKISNFKTNHSKSVPVGEIKTSNQQFINKLQLSKNNNYSRTAMLGVVATKQALSNARVNSVNDCKTGLISATSVGGMDMTEQYYYDYLTNESLRKYIRGHHAGDSTYKIAKELGISDFVTTISTACSSSANAIMLGARLIKAKKLDRVIVGGTDCLSKFTINGFKTLMILTDTYSTPFDKNRKGLNLGEAAAFLVLESERVVKRDKKRVLAYVSGYGNANDAFHQTASSENGEGATLAMQKAFKISGLQLSDIDYINAHGTATPNNDLSESKALIRVFGNTIPAISSTKAFTGHTLAAAGAVEAVYSVLAIQNSVIFPNLNFTEPILETGIVPQTKVKYQEINHVLSNSFGFGGNCSTLIFSKN